MGDITRTTEAVLKDADTVIRHLTNDRSKTQKYSPNDSLISLLAELSAKLREKEAYLEKVAHAVGCWPEQDLSEFLDEFLANAKLREGEWQPIEKIYGREGRALLLWKNVSQIEEFQVEEFQYGEQPEYPYGVGWFTRGWEFELKEKDYSHFLIIPTPPKKK